MKVTDRKQAVILMYHRVTTLTSDPWSLNVTPAHFAEHLQVLSSMARTVPLQSLSNVLDDHRLPMPVAITFDDGYADNLLEALPVLERFNQHATVFVTSGAMRSRREFWWDELEALLLQPGMYPSTLKLGIGGETYHWELGDSAVCSGDDFVRFAPWKAPMDPPTPRHASFVALWQLLQDSSETRQQNVLNALRAWVGRSPCMRTTHRTMNLNEVAYLATHNLIEIGAHTVTHPLLNALPVPVQRREVVDCKIDLEEVTGQPVTSFAFPYGSRPAGASVLLREAGFLRACTTDPYPVSPMTDPMQLPRVHVDDWDGDEFARRLGAWRRRVA